MRHKFLSLVAATCMVGLMAVSSQALEPVSSATLSSISAKGVDVNNYSYVSLSDSQNWAYGIVIADLSSSAVNNQANIATYGKNLTQGNTGTATNTVESKGSVTQNSGVYLSNSEQHTSGIMITNTSSSAVNNQANVAWNFANPLDQVNSGTATNTVTGTESVTQNSGVNLTNGSEAFAAGLMIVNASASAANNQLNLVGNSLDVSQLNWGIASNIIDPGCWGSNCGDNDHNNNNGKTIKTTSGVALSGGSENNTTGLMIANMSSSAANTQINVSSASGVLCSLPTINQTNVGAATNVIRAGF